MISNESSSQTHATAPTQKKYNQCKNVKRGSITRRRGSNNQMTTNKDDDNRDDQSDFSTPEDNNKIAETATGLIGTCVQVFAKMDTQHKGTLAETSSAAHDHLELLLKAARDTRHGLKKGDLALSTEAKTKVINNNDLANGIPARRMEGQNVVKIDQEVSENRTRQERCLQVSQPPTTVVLDEESLANLELRDSPSFSGTPSRDQSTTHEKLFGLKTDFNEEIHTAKLERSAADFKSPEQKSIALANEIERSTFDEERFGSVTKHTTKHSGKSSVKKEQPKTLHRNNNSKNRQTYQSSTPGQTGNQTTSSGNFGKRTNKYVMTLNTSHYTNSTDAPHTAPHANRNSSHWPISNPKQPHRKNYQNKKWIRNDDNAHSTPTNNCDAPIINNIESASNNKTHVVPPGLLFKFNIFASEFIPSGGPQILHNGLKTNDIAPSASTTSSDSSLATPRTPPPNNQKFVSVNDMFTAPFNKPGYSRPQNTVPLWLYGCTSYRNHPDFIARPDMGLQMNQWFYGYHQFDLSPYSTQPYSPYYHYQEQCKPMPQNYVNMMYPSPAFYGNNLPNYQSYPGVFPYQNQHHRHHQGENHYSAPIFN